LKIWKNLQIVLEKHLGCPRRFKGLSKEGGKAVKIVNVNLEEKQGEEERWKTGR